MISYEAFNALSLERDRWQQQCVWLKTYAEELQAALIEKTDECKRLRRELEDARDNVAVLS